MIVPTAAFSKVHLAMLAAEDEASRFASYQRAWKAYDGEGPESLETDPGETNDNIRLDYAKLIVDKGVSFLVGKEGGVTIQVDGPGSDDPEPEPEGDEPAPPKPTGPTDEDSALAKLDEVWSPDERQIDFHNLATNGGVCGQAWLRLYENGNIQVLDPANVTVVWAEDNFQIVEQFLITWNTVDRSDGIGLGCVRRLRIEPDEALDPTKWTIVEEEHDEDSSDWHWLDESLWDHPYAPLLGTQNLPSPNTFYGQADLEPAILDQIEQLESIASDMRRIVRLHGHPVPVITGEEASRIVVIDVSIGELLAIPNPEAQLSQLAVAELTSSLALFQELKTSLFETAHIPKVALGDTTNAGPTAGVALRIEYEPLTERTSTKRMTYGFLLVEAVKRILDLNGFPADSWDVSLVWPELIRDQEADAMSDEAEQRMGIVSRQTLAEKRGYDWEVEKQRIEEETPDFSAGQFTLTGGYGERPAPIAPTGPAADGPPEPDDE